MSAWLIAGCAASHDSEASRPSIAVVEQAATVGTNFVDQVLVTGFSDGTAFAMAPDGRIFIAQQGGALRVFKNGALLSTPFVTVPTSANGERGLLGVAIDPNFASNQFIYVYYTASSPTRNRVVRYTAQGDVAASGSATPIFDLDNLSSATNHNGGAINFGADGKLYVAAGDNANGANAQNLNTVLGKMLRINADGSIPSDNPFFAGTSGNNRAIWAYGLRNPFTFGFQPGSGRLFINDVGENTWEEINEGFAGA
ncbi:MAG TPA: PQQ-dependent sugar dehydrogenase, partial [Polyangiales bacterium]|nr:PQQ-dependent sugar dehydrogenase [Polyangiales bacterium]